MGIDVSVQYNGGLLPDMIMLTEGCYHRGTPLTTIQWFYIYSLSILPLPCVMVYYIASGVLSMFYWRPCMAINVSIQYNGGLLPDIILLTQCYFHRGTRLNAMKRFSLSSL